MVVTVRLTDHLTDPDLLRIIAPGIDRVAPTRAHLDRIAHHETAHGRTLVDRNGAQVWTGSMPSLDLVREAAPDIMAQFPEPVTARRRGVLLRRADARLAARADAVADRSADIDVIERRRVHDEFYALDIVRLRHETYAGGRSEPIERAVFVSYDAVVMLPYDPISDRVLIVEQFRVGPWGRGDPDPWMAEPVAGLIDPGESAETTAIREAEEEAGLTIERLIRFGGGYTSPGPSSGFHHHYIGLCSIPEASRIGGLDSEGEDIRAIPMPASRLFEMLDAGELRNVPLMVCAMALRERRAALRAG